MIVARRYLNENEYEVERAAASAPLPDGSFCFAPGFYTFGGVGWRCDLPGRYLFMDTQKPVIEQRLLWNGDLYGFLSGLAWCHNHGTGDAGYFWSDIGIQLLANAMRRRRCRITCGHITQLALWLLRQIGYGGSRQVTAITRAPRNGFDDGHVMVEVGPLPGGYRLWDLTCGRYFTDAAGVHLSLARVVELGPDLCTQVRIDSGFKSNDDMAGALDMGLYAEIAHSTPERRAAWDRRIFQSWQTP